MLQQIRTYIYLQKYVLPKLQNNKQYKIKVNTTQIGNSAEFVIAQLHFPNIDQIKINSHHPTRQQYQILKICLYSIRQSFQQFILSLTINQKDKQVLLKFIKEEKAFINPVLQQSTGEYIFDDVIKLIKNKFDGVYLSQQSRLYNIVKVINWKSQIPICQFQIKNQLEKSKFPLAIRITAILLTISAIIYKFAKFRK